MRCSRNRAPGRSPSAAKGGCGGRCSCAPRREGAVALDTVNVDDPADLEALLTPVLEAERGPLECFAREGSPLSTLLAGRGFEMPEFFRVIGPLVEWRQGPAANIGLSDRVQSLNWF